MGFSPEEVPCQKRCRLLTVTFRSEFEHLGGGGGGFRLGKVTAETKAWLRVPELWMACRVSEVCGEHTCALI